MNTPKRIGKKSDASKRETINRPEEETEKNPSDQKEYEQTQVAKQFVSESNLSLITYFT